MITKRNFLTLLGIAPIAATAKESDGWLPIETAPHDQVIMLYAREGDLAGCNQRVAIGKYACSWTGATDKRERILFELFQYTLDDGTNMARVMAASYWKPLPKPPEDLA